MLPPTALQISLPFEEPEEKRDSAEQCSGASMPWIKVAPGTPYFITENGAPWTPIGQNDAITWPDLQGLFRRKNLTGAEAYLKMLKQHGVTCLRLMLEYCQGENRYLERPAGIFQPNMVQLWDDLFLLCEKNGLRILLTPYDTYWMWRRWAHHPYHREKGGPCAKRTLWLLCAENREAIKKRLLFATQRWGGSGALFAWDLWNEIHPKQGGNSAKGFDDFITDISGFLSETERRLYGKAHLQTVSLFSPLLERDKQIAEAIFQHPFLHFSSLHLYEKGTIDYPKNTVEAAISVGRQTRKALKQITDNRPFLDSEHGPIHAFKDRRKTLAEAFDDEYFRHMQWAHFASGGAGGGMRWPNRHPHTLTAGMRLAQQGLASFIPLIKWTTFKRQNLNEEIQVSCNGMEIFGCGDKEQAIVWLLRTGSIKKGMVKRNTPPLFFSLSIPFLEPGCYQITHWDTLLGKGIKEEVIRHQDFVVTIPLLQLHADLALAVRRVKA